MPPKKPEPPKFEKYQAERIKCKEPKKRIARSEPVRKVEPEGSSTEDSDTDSDSFVEPALVQPARRAQRPLTSSPRRNRSPSPDSFSIDLEPLVVEPRKPKRLVDDKPVDLEALKDKYRPKSADKAPDNNKNDTKASPEPEPGTILLEPIRPPTPPVEEIKAEPIQPVYVEMKKPLRRKYETTTTLAPMPLL